ncbi:MAG: 2-hydroxyacyl-CoA dehydratase, partial [Nitrospirae bacterium]
SGEACALWQRFLDGNRERPARHTFFDHVILMAPAVVLRGREEAVAFYRRLLDEAAARGPALERERARLYWEGMPVWGKNRFLAEFFARRGVAVVASTYCHSWTFDFSGDDPLEAMARAYTELFITRSEQVKRDALLAACRAFAVDGVVFHEAKTCPHNTNTRFGLPQRLEAAGGPPTVTVFGDLVDLRHFSEEAFTFRMEAFLERLGL